IEPATLDAIREKAPLARHLSGERLAMELEKLLAAARPSVGLRLLGDTGLLEVLSPDLAAQRGVPQNKVEGEDLWDHTLRTVDAAPAGRPVVRLAALVHDIGKPATLDDGPFRGHEILGVSLATAFLERLRLPKTVVERVGHLVRHHMFAYEPDWGDGGVRRFIRRVGRPALEDLFALRAADSLGSGLPADAGGLAELRSRVDEQLANSAVVERGGLAIDGKDLITDLGVPQGPTLGRILDRLVERVIVDPTLNDRPTLLLLAEELLAEEGAR
ncbi:MAG TPA: HD domain-containing protein, partial [Candidatus Binatus sp.]|nr:HD domain-containing protein [Candidatus Binatus sp.]